MFRAGRVCRVDLGPGPGSWETAAYIVNRRSLLLVSFLASCSSDPDPTPADECAVKPLVAGGSVELGLGSTFTPVVNGQTADLQLGAQGLWMFVVNARVRDMSVGSDREGIIEAAVLDQSGNVISLGLGCRLREFVETADGFLQVTSPYLVPLVPDDTPIDGTTVKIRLEVRDEEGRRATDERSVVAHVPG